MAFVDNEHPDRLSMHAKGVEAAKKAMKQANVCPSQIDVALLNFMHPETIQLWLSKFK